MLESGWRMMLTWHFLQLYLWCSGSSSSSSSSESSLSSAEMPIFLMKPSLSCSFIKAMSCNKKKKRLEIIRLNDNKDPEGKPKPNLWDVDDPWCFLIIAVASVHYYLGLEPLPALSFPSPILIRHHNVCAGIGIARKSPPSLDQYILNTGHVAGRLRWKVWWLIPELGAFMMKQATFDYSYDKLNVYLGFFCNHGEYFG